MTPEGCEVLASYDHPHWGKYAAITRNKYGKGEVTYLGTWPSVSILKSLFRQTIQRAGLETPDQQLSFPVIVKHGVNQKGKQIHYYLNYSEQSQLVEYPYKKGIDLLSSTKISNKADLKLEPWGVIIIEED